jgi:hypothetical protein
VTVVSSFSESDRKFFKSYVGFEVLTAVVMEGSTCYLFHAGFLLGFFFDFENGGDVFLRKVGCFSVKHLYVPEDRTLQKTS